MLALVMCSLAYVSRVVPVNLGDRALLGMQWEGTIYVDTGLPFGLKSALKIFTAVADALEWCMRQQGVTLVRHNVDDYITFGRPRMMECAVNMAVILDTCKKRLGVPIAPEKCKGPKTYLGIEVDTLRMELRLPQEKLGQVKQVI